MKLIVPNTKIKYSGIVQSVNVIAILSLCLFLPACTGDLNDLSEYIKTTKLKYQGSVEPLPQFEPYQNHVYATSNLRDPFLQKSEENIEQSATADDGLSPDQARRKEPLEFFPMDSLKMVGTLEQSGATWGLIQDPEGTIHRVQPSNHAGENYGEITRISEEAIEILEIIPDGLGTWIEREVVLSIGED